MNDEGVTASTTRRCMRRVHAGSIAAGCSEDCLSRVLGGRGSVVASRLLPAARAHPEARPRMRKVSVHAPLESRNQRSAEEIVRCRGHSRGEASRRSRCQDSTPRADAGRPRREAEGRETLARTTESRRHHRTLRLSLADASVRGGAYACAFDGAVKSLCVPSPATLRQLAGAVWLRLLRCGGRTDATSTPLASSPHLMLSVCVCDIGACDVCRSVVVASGSSCSRTEAAGCSRCIHTVSGGGLTRKEPRESSSLRSM